MRTVRRSGAGGRDVSTCVNITPRRLLENTFIQEVHRTLERYQVPRNCLTLEITEHSELSREAAASPRVRELQAMGVRVAVDDLGAGFNTALALQSLAADTVKIDAALVAQAHQNEWHAKVLGGIVTICRQLGLRQIVEGIELDEQHRVVQQFDTELAQGYLYGRPVSSEEFGRLHLGVHSDSNSASASD